MQVDKMSTSIDRIGRHKKLLVMLFGGKKTRTNKLQSNKEHYSDISKATRRSNETPTSQREGW